MNSQNLELQQRLKSLKTELNTQGHDVDMWLNSCADADHSVSTETASEAEMYRSFDDDQSEHSQPVPIPLPVCKTSNDTPYFSEHNHLDRNNNHQEIQSILPHSCMFISID